MLALAAFTDNCFGKRFTFDFNQFKNIKFFVSFVPRGNMADNAFSQKVTLKLVLASFHFLVYLARLFLFTQVISQLVGNLPCVAQRQLLNFA